MVNTLQWRLIQSFQGALLAAPGDYVFSTYLVIQVFRARCKETGMSPFCFRFHLDTDFQAATSVLTRTINNRDITSTLATFCTFNITTLLTLSNVSDNLMKLVSLFLSCTRTVLHFRKYSYPLSCQELDEKLLCTLTSVQQILHVAGSSNQLVRLSIKTGSSWPGSFSGYLYYSICSWSIHDSSFY